VSEAFGPFQLEQLIAVGGVAEVWRVTRDGVTAALKRMHTHLVHNPEACAVFASEQQLVVGLPRHPHVVHGIAAGTIGDVPYALLDLAPGLDLRRIVTPLVARDGAVRTSSPLARLRVIDLMAQACDGIAHLHAHGWIHGDVNPSNLVVSDDDRLTVVDLGVARPAGHGGTVRGTHAYMAPEQVKGEAWTPATDVFGLGVVLWELAANARLFHRGPSWLSMAAVIEAEVPRLNDRVLDAITRAALVKDPTSRLGSANELGDQLRAARDN
jgi:eukaryotic-like serine/threonine-protein kinase